MRRIRLLWLAPVAAIALAGGIATSGTAQSGTATHTITFTAKSAKGGFFPKGRPRPGDRFGFTDRVTGSDGSKGHDYGSCTLVTRNQAVCQVQFVMNTGQLSAQVPVTTTGHVNTGSITGGTGAYFGAQGQGTAKDINKNTTKITVELLG
jgi:hypothetical protein